ncbi:hypothetical protein HAZT_HAZT005800 [Hyalella azteca]|uniref:Urocanase N-terminal domain-containing protein n=1 Tax=Hyalella azteca TaxID=294128 RepID=A0A6A0H7P2_HYAAZ|nr:hypothetical protein HAZT_HAZT005800 [Hyalella azteca]
MATSELARLCSGLPLSPLPPPGRLDPNLPHAPRRTHSLTPAQQQAYPCRTKQAAAVMLMIMNNLDPAVAQYPQELVTYGGNGQVFSNWAQNHRKFQFWITMHYLSTMTEDQTLVLSSGHPVGLFPSHPDAPRVVISNGMVIPNYSSRQRYDDMFALGVTMWALNI